MFDKKQTVFGDLRKQFFFREISEESRSVGMYAFINRQFCNLINIQNIIYIRKFKYDKKNTRFLRLPRLPRRFDLFIGAYETPLAEEILFI